MKNREAEVERNTKETQIVASIDLDGNGEADLKADLPFLEHMLEQVARHGMMDLKIHARGDLQIDAHHTVEDIGIGIAFFHLNATPFYVMIIVYLFGSDWNWMQVLGAAILTVGTLLAQLPEKDPIHDSGVKS